MKENYVHEMFAPGFDPYGNNAKIEREEDLPINGVNLRTSAPPDADEAGDETYALPADKGVATQVIPDDQLPTDTEGNKAELLIPERHLACPNVDFDMDIFYGLPSHSVIPVYAKPKAHINRQRQGYSRRKAKRAYQPRYKYMLKVSKFWDPLMTHLRTFDVPTRSDVHMEQFMGRVRNKLEVGSFTQPTKPQPHGEGDING